MARETIIQDAHAPNHQHAHAHHTLCSDSTQTHKSRCIHQTCQAGLPYQSWLVFRRIRKPANPGVVVQQQDARYGVRACVRKAEGRCLRVLRTARTLGGGSLPHFLHSRGMVCARSMLYARTPRQPPHRLVSGLAYCAILPVKQRVVIPAAVHKRLLHLWPNILHTTQKQRIAAPRES